MTQSTTWPNVSPDALEGFRGRLRAGDTAGAFFAVKALKPEAASMLMLATGFSVQSHHGSNARSFWAKVQTDIVKACRARKDGYEMRES